MKKPLAPKRLRFVEEYLKDRNATQAAIRAGYAGGGAARVTGTRLLADPAVAAAIAKRAKKVAAQADIAASEVLGELAILLRSDVRHFVVSDVTGAFELAEGAPPDAWRAVSSIKCKTRTIAHNGDTETIHEAELRLWSKPDAARMLGEHLGLFPQRHKVQFGDLAKLSDEELTARRKELGLP